MDERIGFGHFKLCGNRGSVGRVSVCRWLGPGSGRMGWCYVCVRCESGLSVWMAGPDIWVLCLADTCASEVYPVFNQVAPYGYLLHKMYFYSIYHKSRLVCLMLWNLD